MSDKFGLSLKDYCDIEDLISNRIAYCKSAIRSAQYLRYTEEEFSRIRRDLSFFEGLKERCVVTRVSLSNLNRSSKNLYLSAIDDFNKQFIQEDLPF